MEPGGRACPPYFLYIFLFKVILYSRLASAHFQRLTGTAAEETRPASPPTAGASRMVKITSYSSIRQQSELELHVTGTENVAQRTFVGLLEEVFGGATLILVGPDSQAIPYLQR